MRSFLLLLLLLLLSLTTGCEAGSEAKGCAKGWVEFTFKYPKTTGKYKDIDVVNPKGRTIRSTEKDVWEGEDRVSLYHDTKTKKLRVAIKQLQREDFGEYKCKFDQRSKSSRDTEEVELEVEKDGCQGQFNQTAYTKAKTTITCDYPGNKSKSRVKFFCKENGFICEDILSTKSSLKSNGTFTLTETNSGFNVSISNVSSHHAGVYWCGEETSAGRYRAALRQIQLEVKDITTFKRSPTVGQNLTYWCGYPNGAPINKFLCKGEDPSICQRLVSTAQLNNTGGFSMKQDKAKINITITVREVTTDDTGTYWCGAESSDNRCSNPFFTRFLITVVSPTVSSTSSTSPVSSTQSSTASAESPGGSRFVIPAVVCVAVLLLLFVLILILIYKRFSKNTRNGAAAQHIKEDYIYEEIQERVQKPDLGNAINTIYATANFPTNPSASLNYSTVNFQSSSDRAGGEALILKPSSSACEYSTVKHSQSPTYSTVNQPSRSSEGPTVNEPQQQRGKIRPVRDL